MTFDLHAEEVGLLMKERSDLLDFIKRKRATYRRYMEAIDELNSTLSHGPAFVCRQIVDKTYIKIGVGESAPHPPRKEIIPTPQEILALSKSIVLMQQDIIKIEGKVIERGVLLDE